MYLRHTASNYCLLYQPINWLATLIAYLKARFFVEAFYTAAPPPLEVSKKLACQPPPTFKNSRPKNFFPQIRPYFGKVPNNLSINNLAS